MDLNQLRSFLAVTQTLNFTNAARQIGVPQSTVSRHIVDLEDQLDVKLFYRTKRDVQLTEEGRTFLPYAREMLEAEEKGAEAVRQLHEGTAGRLSIAAAASGPVLMDCLRAFGQEYPDIVVDLSFPSGGGVLLEEGEDPCDFHFLPRDLLPCSEEFDSLETDREELCLVAAKGRMPDPENLQTGKFILVSESENPILYMLAMEYFRSRRCSPEIVNESGDVRAVLVSAGAGLGATILPGSLARSCLPGELEILPLGMEISYAAAWKKSLLNPAARLFLEVLRARVRNP